MFDGKHGSECKANFKLMKGYFQASNTETIFFIGLEIIVGL